MNVWVVRVGITSCDECLKHVSVDVLDLIKCVVHILLILRDNVLIDWDHSLHLADQVPMFEEVHRLHFIQDVSTRHAQREEGVRVLVVSLQRILRKSLC